MTCRQIPLGLCSPEALVKGAEHSYSERDTCCLALTELKGRGGSWLQCLVHTSLCINQARGPPRLSPHFLPLFLRAQIKSLVATA